MKRIIIYVVFFIFSTQLHSIGLPDGNLISKEEAKPPNPLELKANWWDYFDVDKEKLVEHKEKTAATFTRIQRRLPANAANKAEPLFNKFLTGLDTLIDLKEKQIPKAVKVGIYPEQYTFSEWFSLGKKLLELNQQLSDLQLKLNLSKGTIKSASKYLDLMFNSYLTGNIAEADKLIAGLEIMNAKLSLVIEQLEYSNLQVFLENKKHEIENLHKEIEHSQNKIDYFTADLSTLQAELDKAKNKALQARDALFQAYDYATRLQQSDIIGLENDIASQQVIETAVVDALEHQKLINAEIQLYIVEWGQKKVQVDHSSLRKKTTAWSQKIEQTKAEIGDWKNNSELVLEQSLKGLAVEKEVDDQRVHNLYYDLLSISENSILYIQTLKNEISISGFLLEHVQMMKKNRLFSFTGKFLGFVDSLKGFFLGHGKWFRQSLFRIGSVPVTPLGLMKIILILVISVIFAKFVRRWTTKFGKKQNRIKQTSVYILSKVLYYVIVILGFLIAGGSIGFDLTAFAYIGGAIVVWVGFGLQSIFHNFISGIIILLTKTMRVNDIIALESGEKGKVLEINLRTTVLLTFDGLELIVPNSEFTSKKFTNWTLSDVIRRISIPFRIGLHEDRQKVVEIVLEAAKKVPITVQDVQPEVWLREYGDNYINCDLVVWINEYIYNNLVKLPHSLYLGAIDDAFKENNIAIPIIQREIIVISDKEKT